VKPFRRVTLLHGLLGHPESLASFAGAVSDALGVPARAVLLPGHGESPWGTDHRSFDEVVDALATRVFPAGAEEELVVGYSLGGRLALGLLARTQPAAILAIGAHLGLGDPDERSARRRWDLQQAERVRELGIEAFAAEWEQEPIFATQQTLLPARLAEQRRARARHLPEAIAWAFDVLGTGSMPDLSPRLAPHRERVTLVAGALDAKFVSHYQAALELSVIVVPNAGHNVLLERPDALLATLRAVSHGEPISKRAAT
jgi:2-succinyl-6-hydroxy-2,4-cyclohexadiene-1-carboxylate synthase